MADNERIYVKNDLFSGWATVTEFFPDEILPIQVELDTPDSDGHSLKRVGKADIIPNKEE
jgi:hypothetical protein